MKELIQKLEGTLAFSAEVETQIRSLDAEAIKAEKAVSAILEDGNIGPKEEAAFMRAKTCLDLVPAKRGRLLRDLKQRMTDLPPLLRQTVAEFNALIQAAREQELQKLAAALAPFWPELATRKLRRMAEDLNAPSVLAFQRRFADAGMNVSDPLALANHARAQAQKIRRVAAELGLPI